MRKIIDLGIVCQRYAIALVYLYGSKAEEGLRYLRGENIKIDDRLTDIDVGVVLKNLFLLLRKGINFIVVFLMNLRSFSVLCR